MNASRVAAGTMTLDAERVVIAFADEFARRHTRQPVEHGDRARVTVYVGQRAGRRRGAVAFVDAVSSTRCHCDVLGVSGSVNSTSCVGGVEEHREERPVAEEHADRAAVAAQSSSVISMPAGVYQAMSLRSLPGCGGR